MFEKFILMLILYFKTCITTFIFIFNFNILLKGGGGV